MAEPFQRYWDSAPDALKAQISRETAQQIFEAARHLTRNQLLVKAAEMMTRPSVHPTRAILEAATYCGFELPSDCTFERLQERIRLQGARHSAGRDNGEPGARRREK